MSVEFFIQEKVKKFKIFHLRNEEIPLNKWRDFNKRVFVNQFMILYI